VEKSEGTMITYQWSLAPQPKTDDEAGWSSLMASMSNIETVRTELQFSPLGILSFVCVTKNKPAAGSSEEVFRKGQRIIEGGEGLMPISQIPWGGKAN
jgi:hypothetical protein